jgi:predicted alpha/beta superfamily hydrolase
VLECKATPGTTVAYKITRGSWSQSECLAHGAPSPNRLLVVPPKDTSLVVQVAGWSDLLAQTPVHTTTNSVLPLSDSVFFPHSGRFVSLRIYLPEKTRTSHMRWPLLLMTDGQNLFDQQSAFSGEWQVDESLDSMQAGMVVVGIDHAGARRLQEYNVGYHQQTGHGYGAIWLQWLSDSVLPYLRNRYPVARQRGNTWIAGSSMGGLISSWAMLLQSEHFGGAGIFSPAYQIADTFFHKKPVLRKQPAVCVWLYAGGAEADWMIPKTEQVYQAFSGATRAISFTSDVLGKNEEAAWRYRFPAFARFMLMWTQSEPFEPGK